MSPLRWTCKSPRRLARERTALGHQISQTVVGQLLKQQKFSLQGSRRSCAGTRNKTRPYRD
jgi:Rhodopirellula transposase DDE domain